MMPIFLHKGHVSFVYSYKKFDLQFPSRNINRLQGKDPTFHSARLNIFTVPADPGLLL